MWKEEISTLMNRLGWGSGFRLPLANEENAALEKELEQRNKKIQEKQEELEDIVKHIKILEKGLQNAEDVIIHNKKLIEAKHAEVAGEREIISAGEREKKKCMEDMKHFQHELSKISKTCQQLISEIERRRENLADLVDLIDYDRQELAKLEQDAEKQDVYLKMLEKVWEDDTESLKQYQFKFKTISEELAISREELQKAVNGTTVCQNQLDGLSERFRKLHKERGEIVSLWKDTLQSLSARDVEMKAIAEEYSKTQQELRALTSKVSAERCVFHDREKTAASSEIQLAKWDLRIGNLREQIKKTNDECQNTRDSIISYETFITMTSSQISEVVKKSKDLDEDIKESTGKIAETEAHLKEIERRLAKNETELLSVADQMKQLNDMVEDEGKKLELITRQMEKAMRAKSQWLLKRRETLTDKLNTERETSNLKSLSALIVKKISDYEDELHKANSRIYSLEVEYITLQMRYRPMLNPKHDENKYNEDEMKITALKKALDEQNNTKNFILSQISKLESVSRRVNKERFNGFRELSGLEANVIEQKSLAQMAEKVLAASTEECKNVIVEQSLARVRLGHLKRTFDQQRLMLFDSEHVRTMLQIAARDKRMEINMHVKLLVTNKRVLSEDILQIRMQVSHANDTIHKKKKKYELIMRLMSKSDEESTKSEAYYVLQMAQEREILKREGDRWDALVKKTEQETEAIQNNVALMNGANDMFKDSLKPTVDEAFLEELNNIKFQIHQHQVQKHKAVKALENIRIDIQKKTENLEKLQETKSIVENKMVDKEYEFRVVDGELHTQTLSIQRSKLLTNKLLSQLNFMSADEKELIFLDIKLKATRKKRNFGVQSLAKNMYTNAYTHKFMQNKLTELYGEKVANSVLRRIREALNTGGFRSGRSLRGSSSSRSSTASPSGGRDSVSRLAGMIKANSVSKKVEPLFSRKISQIPSSKSVVDSSTEKLLSPVEQQDQGQDE